MGDIGRRPSANMRYLLSIISKDESFSIPEESVSRWKERHEGSDAANISNNRENLTVVCNRMINKALSEGYDFLIIMHSDAEIDLEKLSDHIEECSSKYDVMGLCGCEKISLSESPLNWFCGSRKFPEFRWGCVCHGELGNLVSFFSGDRPETTDHAVACIDGLCMILSRKAMESGLRFDENLRYNCYDTQISLDAQMTYGLRVGVLVEPELKHFSVGKSIMEDAFLDDEIVLRKLFNLEIPPGSRLETYVESRKA